MTLSLISDATATASLSKWQRDNYLSGLPWASGAALETPIVDGVFMFDTSHPYSWAKQGQPLEAEAIKNLAGQDDSVWRVETQSSSGPLAWDAGTKSVSFAAVKRGRTGVLSPSTWLADEFGATTDPNYLLWIVVKLPALASWPTVKGSVNGLIGDSTGPSGAGLNTEFAQIAMVRNNDTGNGGAGNRALWFSVAKTGTSSVDTITINEANGESLADLAGHWCILAEWRKTAERGIYAAPIADTADAVIKTSATINAQADSLTGRQLVWGLAGTADVTNTYSHLVGAGAIENLTTTGRDPTALMNDLRLRLRNRGLWTA